MLVAIVVTAEINVAIDKLILGGSTLLLPLDELLVKNVAKIVLELLNAILLE